MKYRLDSFAFQARLLLLTALLAMLGFAFTSQFQDSALYSDDTPIARMAEIQELSGDAKSPLQSDTSFDALLTSILLVLPALLFTSVTLRNNVTPRLTFLYHIRPRSPPLFPLL